MAKSHKTCMDQAEIIDTFGMYQTPIRIVLRKFYFGLSKWCKHSFDLIAEGEFLECDEARALEIIYGLSSYFLYDQGIDTLINRLATIKKG